MDIRINEKTVRDMADRLRSDIGNELVSRAKAMETVACVLGYKNWDTLSGVLKKETKAAQKRVFKLDAAVQLLKTCFSTSDFGTSFPYCKVEVDQEFIDTLLKLRRTCVEQGLTEAREYWATQWGPDGDDGEHDADRMSVSFCELVVDKDYWYFEAAIKHADYSVQSRGLNIDKFLQALETKQSPDEYLVWHKGHLVYDPSGDTDATLDTLKDYGEL